MDMRCCEISFLLRRELFDCMVESIEEKVDVVVLIVGGLVEEW